MLSIENLLFYILMFPIIGILILLLIPSREEKLLKVIALNFSCFPFPFFLFLDSTFSAFFENHFENKSLCPALYNNIEEKKHR